MTAMDSVSYAFMLILQSDLRQALSFPCCKPRVAQADKSETLPSDILLLRSE